MKGVIGADRNLSKPLFSRMSKTTIAKLLPVALGGVMATLIGLAVFLGSSQTAAGIPAPEQYTTPPAPTSIWSGPWVYIGVAAAVVIALALILLMMILRRPGAGSSGTTDEEGGEDSPGPSSGSDAKKVKAREEESSEDPAPESEGEATPEPEPEAEESVA